MCLFGVHFLLHCVVLFVICIVVGLVLLNSVMTCFQAFPFLLLTYKCGICALFAWLIGFACGLRSVLVFVGICVCFCFWLVCVCFIWYVWLVASFGWFRICDLFASVFFVLVICLCLLYCL